jgi:hypothetical protein
LTALQREIIEAKNRAKRQTPGIVQANDNRPRTAAKAFDDAPPPYGLLKLIK